MKRHMESDKLYNTLGLGEGKETKGIGIIGIRQTMRKLWYKLFCSGAGKLKQF